MNRDPMATMIPTDNKSVKPTLAPLGRLSSVVQRHTVASPCAGMPTSQDLR